jgi:hypothetical protein
LPPAGHWLDVSLRSAIILSGSHLHPQIDFPVDLIDLGLCKVERICDGLFGLHRRFLAGREFKFLHVEFVDRQQVSHRERTRVEPILGGVGKFEWLEIKSQAKGWRFNERLHGQQSGERHEAAVSAGAEDQTLSLGS